MERLGGMLREIYSRYQNYIENILFPLILVLYPLVKINQGIDVADTTYSLANFQYFGSMDGTWMVATFLANAVGSLFMRLPFGGTLMGMYFYTALVQSLTALVVYEALRRRLSVRIPAALVFGGELIALGLCWCPSTILYNYLTYLLMSVGVILLYRGILEENRKYYVAAGFFLGMNVAVRMPNVVQAAFIVAVWYGGAVNGKAFLQSARDTLWCIAGYAVGFGMPLAAICARYGIGAYPAMVQTMFAMTEKATDYKPSAMLTGMLGDYITGLCWLAFAGACMAGGRLLLAVQRKWFAQKHGAVILCCGIYVAVFAVLLRFYWGRGMFTFLYYEYSSMYYPTVLLLVAAVCMGVYCLLGKEVGKEQRIMAVLVLVQIFVTPLGSNNALYPIINNLFLVVPFVLWVCYGRIAAWKRRGSVLFPVGSFVWAIPFAMLVVFVFVQSVGFHMTFSFQDGIDGVARDVKLSAPDKAAGVYTNQDNAAWLSELAEYTESAGLTGRKVILYGEVPGLGYLLDMPSALSTFWADLDSYRMAEYERDLDRIEIPPVVIVSSPIAAYLNEDADGMNWFGVKKEVLDGDGKLQILADYMAGHGYEETFGNGRYVVYVTEEQ